LTNVFAIARAAKFCIRMGCRASNAMDVAGFWTLRSHDDHWTECRHPETAHDTVRPMIVPFDDLELVYQSLRNSSRHIRANFRASMRRSPDWAPFNLGT
jgi:hypothetical protein